MLESEKASLYHLRTPIRIVPTMTFPRQSIYPPSLRYYYLQKGYGFNLSYLSWSLCVVQMLIRQSESQQILNQHKCHFIYEKSFVTFHSIIPSVIHKQSKAKQRKVKKRQLSDIHTKNHLVMTITKNSRKPSVIPFTTLSNDVSYAHDDPKRVIVA